MVALARVIRREWGRFHERRRLSATGLWGIAVLVTFLRGAPLVLATVGNYGRLLLLAPIVLRDVAAAADWLAALFGRRFDGAVVVLAAGFLGLLLYYQYALYPSHLAGLNQTTHFLDSGWFAKVDGSTPWLYRP